MGAAAGAMVHQRAKRTKAVARVKSSAGDDLFLITHRRIYEAYEELCFTGGLVDFAELLLRSHELWLEDAGSAGSTTSAASSICWSTSSRIRTRSSTHGCACSRVNGGRVVAVGDDDQSIYGWRGARIENIHRFRQDFRDVAIIRLEQNYRSTGTILKAANALIDHNTDRLGKELWTNGVEGDPIALYAAYNELDEARFIADRIEDWIAQGGSADRRCGAVSIERTEPCVGRSAAACADSVSDLRWTAILRAARSQERARRT